MIAPVRKPQPAIIETRPNLRLVGSPSTGPRIAAFARLPAKKVRRDFSFVAGLAFCFFLATIIIIGLTGGTVIWFAYDTHTAAAVPGVPKFQSVRVKVETKAPPPELSLAAPPAVLQVAQLLDEKKAQSPLPISLDMIVPESKLSPAKHEKQPAPVAPVMAPPASTTPAAVTPVVNAASVGDIQLAAHDAMSPEKSKDALQAAADVATARTLVGQSRLMEAIAEMEKAVRAVPGNVSYRFNLAILYDRAGQGHDALALYRQVLKAAEYGEVPDNASLIDTSASEEKTGRISPQALNTVRTRVDYLEGLERE